MFNKVCNKCGIEKENTSDFFGFTPGGNLRNECKSCQNERAKKNKKKDFICESCREKFQASKYRKTNLCTSCVHARKSEEEKKITKRDYGRRYYNTKIRDSEKKCESCSNIFKPTHNKTKYCSNECNPWIKTGEALDKYREALEKECDTCGKLFTATTIQIKYCSTKCRSRAENRKKEMRRGIRGERILSNGNVDVDISLEKLIQRDNNTCYLCGGECNNNDYTVTDEGYHIAGNYYPSIDHVIAIANGGTHTWDNVLLTHRICNSIKSDKTLI